MLNSKALDAGVLYLKGMAMGAADIVPGVSGGTVAFITGIYTQLVDSIGAIGPATLTTLVRQGPVAAWHSFNGNFLLTLMLGILSSVVLLSNLISHWLAEYPELLWSFFFGLIVISAIHIGRQIERWSPLSIAILIGGAVAAFLITRMSPAEVTPSLLLIFGSGALAICAMILPGISGSFILLMLGMYTHVLAAIKGFDFGVIIIFALGCLTGLLLFTRLLSWLLHHKRDFTLALLTGFMIGSLNKVWPWKHTLTFRTNSHGEQVPLQQVNVWPQHYQALTGQNPELMFGIGLMLAAVILVLLLEQIGKRSVPATANGQ